MIKRLIERLTERWAFTAEEKGEGIEYRFFTKAAAVSKAAQVFNEYDAISNVYRVREW